MNGQPVSPRPTFDALVLAADRTGTDPVAASAGVACKAAASAGGIPLLGRVVSALSGVPGLRRIHVVGPADAALERCRQLRPVLATSGVTREAPSHSPSLSAAAGLRTLGTDGPVLLTTADHALLSTAVAARFVHEALETGADVAVGLVSHARVAQRFPGARRTRLRFSDDTFCTCNLFLVQGAGGARVVDFWVNVEQRRKHPARLVAGVLGPVGLAGYALGMLSLRGALARASARMGARIVPVILDDAEASVDVDTPEDLALVEQILTARRAR